MSKDDKEHIPVFRPSYGKDEHEALRQPLASGWVGYGPRSKQFEKEFARYIGVPFTVGTNSCTAALHMALKVAGVEGGEVITTPMTFISTNHAILYNNADPVFCDIEKDTLNIDASKIEPLITPRTRAILVVHYGGHPCDMDAVGALAQEKGLKVIEDVAHGCGGEFRGRKLGSFGYAGCFSFHAVKNLACGEGGMVTTADGEAAARLHKLKWMGISRDTWSRSEIDGNYSWFYTVEEIGYKYHINDINASIGLVQLGKLEALNARRRQISETFNSAFADLDWLETPVVREYALSAHHNYVVKVDRRDELIDHLAAEGVATSVHYFPNHLYDIYRPWRRECPVTESVWKRIVTLPLFPDLTNRQIDRIIEAVRSFGAHR